MDFCVVDEAKTIQNIIVCETEEDAKQFGALPHYEGASIGQAYAFPASDEAKAERIAQSKTDLASYLESHPLQWTDGKYYSITSEKQQWLTSKLFSASAAKAAGEDYPLTWNDTEEVCTAWTYENLWALARAIDTRVTALVTYQQTQEVAMRNAATQEELDAIVVDYDTVGAAAQEALL